MVSAGNVVRIDVVADTKQAKEGFKSVKGQAEGLKKTGAGLSNVMGGVGKAMGIVGFGAISVGVVFKEVLKASNALTRSTTSARFSLIGMGDAGVGAFDKMQPRFKDIAAEVHTTQAEVATAMGILTATTNSAQISATNLADVFKIAQVSGQDFEQVARAMGQAMYGDITAINDLVRGQGPMIGNFAKLEQIVKMAREEFEDSRTVTDEFGAALRKAFEDLGTATDSFTKSATTLLTILSGIHTVFKTMSDPVNMAKVAIKGITELFDEGFGPALKKIGEGLGTFALAIVGIKWSDFLIGWDKADTFLTETIPNAFGDAKDAVGEFLSKVVEAGLEPFKLDLSFGLGAIPGFIKNFFTDDGEAKNPEAKINFGFSIGAIKGIMATFFNAVTGVPISDVAVSAALSFGINKVSDFIGEFFDVKTGDATLRYPSAMLDFFKGAVPDFIKTFFDDKGEMLKSQGEAVISFASEIGTFIKSFFWPASGDAKSRPPLLLTTAFVPFIPTFLTKFIDKKAGDMIDQGFDVAVNFSKGLLSAGWDTFVKVFDAFTASPTMKLNFEIVMGAWDKIKTLWDLIQKIDSGNLPWPFGSDSSVSVSPVVPVNPYGGFGDNPYGPEFPGFAHGGVAHGGPTIVGEKGPELVNLPSGSYVKPSLTGIGGSSITVNINESFILDESTLNKLVLMIRDELDTQLRTEAATL